MSDLDYSCSNSCCSEEYSNSVQSASGQCGMQLDCQFKSWTSYTHGTRMSRGEAYRTTSIPRHRLIKWSLPPPLVITSSMPGWKSMPFGLETFWQSAFAWFFQPFYAQHGHIWTLEPTDVTPVSVEWPWHSLTYSAKVRFICMQSHGWTSMKGQVVFWYRMRRQGSQIICEVLFRLYGQECSRCQQPSEYSLREFVSPLWYPEEIENAFRFLSSKVKRIYYGGFRKDPCELMHIRKCERGRYSTYFHDPVRCQACAENRCCRNSSIQFFNNRNSLFSNMCISMF